MRATFFTNISMNVFVGAQNNTITKSQMRYRSVAPMIDLSFTDINDFKVRVAVNKFIGIFYEQGGKFNRFDFLFCCNL